MEAGDREDVHQSCPGIAIAQFGIHPAPAIDDERLHRAGTRSVELPEGGREPVAEPLCRCGGEAQAVEALYHEDPVGPAAAIRPTDPASLGPSHRTGAKGPPIGPACVDVAEARSPMMLACARRASGLTGSSRRTCSATVPSRRRAAAGGRVESLGDDGAAPTEQRRNAPDYSDGPQAPRGRRGAAPRRRAQDPRNAGGRSRDRPRSRAAAVRRASPAPCRSARAAPRR